MSNSQVKQYAVFLWMSLLNIRNIRLISKHFSLIIRPVYAQFRYFEMLHFSNLGLILWRVLSKRQCRKLIREGDFDSNKEFMRLHIFIHRCYSNANDKHYKLIQVLCERYRPHCISRVSSFNWCYFYAYNKLKQRFIAVSIHINISLRSIECFYISKA